MTELGEYREKISDDIETVIGSSPFQPIVFAGTGLSIRYFSAPTWDGLLKEMAGRCPKLEQNYGYFRQSRTPPEVGQLIADRYAQWAWDMNESKFDDEVLDFNQSPDIYLKMEVCRFFQDLTPPSVDDISEDDLDGDLALETAKNELEKFKKIQPHAVITTNYDQFIERVLNDGGKEQEDRYQVVVGEEVLSSPFKNVGEILKIHGSSTDPSSLILTDEDYDKFNDRRRYLSSKMLTYFAEHPVLIVGYSASDSNVRKILSWVNRLQPGDEITAEDIYFLEYDEDIEERESIPTHKRIQLGKDRYIEVNRIVAKDFDWVFESFAAQSEFNIDIRRLRKILANTYEVVRSKTPAAKVVDHKRIEDVAEDQEKLATVLGIATSEDSLNFEFDHDLSPGELEDELGINSTYEFKREVLKSIHNESGINLTKFNNKYHIAFFDRSVEYRAYSTAAVELFRRVLDGEDWSLDIPEERIPEEEYPDRGLNLDSVN